MATIKTNKMKRKIDYRKFTYTEEDLPGIVIIKNNEPDKDKIKETKQSKKNIKNPKL